MLPYLGCAYRWNVSSDFVGAEEERRARMERRTHETHQTAPSCLECFSVLVFFCRLSTHAPSQRFR